MKTKVILILAGLSVISFVPAAYAMHIAEGMLKLSWCGVWWAVCLPFLAVGLYRAKKMKSSNPFYTVLLSVMAAAVFVFSMLPIPVPITGTTSHPTATPLSGMILGVWSTVIVSLLSLFIQAVFLGHGGLSTLGANLFSMGVVGPSIAVFIFYALKKAGVFLGLRVFISSFLANILIYTMTAFQLSLSLSDSGNIESTFAKFVVLFMPIQLPIAAIEGFLAVGIIKYIQAHKPQIINHLI